jgi:hypothetical protein
MREVYLDGKKVDALIITPEKHKLIGMFRPIEWGCVCPQCGLINPNLDVSIVKQHWIDGYFDLPQYQTIEQPVDQFESFKYHTLCAMATLYPGKSTEEVTAIIDSYKDLFEIKKP